MSGLLGNDNKKQDNGIADGATGVAKTGTGSKEYPPASYALQAQTRWILHDTC